MVAMHEGLRSWTPDQVAECLSVGRDTYSTLWELLSNLIARGEAVPLGGDGSDGTIEYPAEQDAYMSGKMGAVWHLLSVKQQEDINQAYQADFG